MRARTRSLARAPVEQPDTLGRGRWRTETAALAATVADAEANGATGP